MRARASLGIFNGIRLPPPDVVWAVISRANSAASLLLFILICNLVLPSRVAGNVIYLVGVATVIANLSLWGRAQFVYADPVQTFEAGDARRFRKFFFRGVLWSVASCVTVIGLLQVTANFFNVADHPGIRDLTSERGWIVAMLSASMAVTIFLVEALRAVRRFRLAAAINPGTGYMLAGVVLLGVEQSRGADLTLMVLLSFFALVAGIGMVMVLSTDAPATSCGAGRVVSAVASNRLTPYAINAIPSILLYQADIVLVGALIGPEALATYAWVSRLASSMNFINSISYAVLPKRVSDSVSVGDLAAVERDVVAVATVLGALNLAFFLAATLYLLVTDANAVLFSILAFAHMVNSALGARSVVLQLCGYPGTQAVVSWIFAIVSASLVALASVNGTLHGVVIAIAGCIIAQAFCEAVMVKWLLGVRTFPVSLPFRR